ncbi:dihydrofolate synthase/folylpolyglutamate synthase [Luteibacter sp. Sphag1AF]|uniref:bifunctional tetrahydrofolate synthase/dihydrofolate synthase n=1 Tax=Luteibacter sp. Sphag1AF TaxID=2587031 RepID=UPI00161E8D49|nr:bifunctional tetrahydrofolate synthase/dihydrofolate synthase [Luteibacter sp. Sphag1AF]MBB3228718.1 dihydrofolate synthase/folylpolyglutamate synthase [Luteibacter sp. Sphag1AF]
MERTLAQWLTYQEGVHPRDIELGLDRVREVWERMGGGQPAPLTITVGGTNGKGSTVALLEAMLRAAGYRTGCYTSPHLLVYNERVRIDGAHATDEALVASFQRIDTARGSIAQTYFEFGTLAALDLMKRAKVDVAILEVGLGGRLDAVNIIDADAVVITTVDLDHQDWLGSDRDSIGIEKAGIARQGRPAIVGETSPPAGLLMTLGALGASVERAGLEFTVHRGADGWRWQHKDGTTFDLPDPALHAPCQHDNAAAAIAVLHALGERVNVDAAALARGLREVVVPGRLQQTRSAPREVVDVGHNPQAARALAGWLDAQPAKGRVFAVYGALADKDVAGVIGALGTRIDGWYIAGLDGATARGLTARAVTTVLQETLPGAHHASFDDVPSALLAARSDASADDTLLVFGSFFVAAAGLSLSM